MLWHISLLRGCQLVNELLSFLARHAPCHAKARRVCTVWLRNSLAWYAQLMLNIMYAIVVLIFFHRALYAKQIGTLLTGVKNANLPGLKNLAMELRKLCCHPVCVRACVCLCLLLFVRLCLCACDSACLSLRSLTLDRGACCSIRCAFSLFASWPLDGAFFAPPIILLSFYRTANIGSGTN